MASSTDVKTPTRTDPHLTIKTATVVDRYITETDRQVKSYTGRSAYRVRSATEKTTLHWGQRKLLLSEIEFLILHGHRSKLVVYAGAAPGTHVPVLASMFRDHTFILFDPGEFSMKQNPNVTCRRECFTDATAAEFKDQPVLFVSDIRTTPPMDEAQIRQDMSAQRRWVERMNPEASMLKFRLSFDKGKTEYFDGDLRFQAYAGQSSTECRLIVTKEQKFALKTYDHGEHESLMFHYNTEFRTMCFTANSINHNPRCDRCGDCAVELFVLRLYVNWAKTWHATLAKMTESKAITFFSRWFDKHLAD